VESVVSSLAAEGASTQSHLEYEEIERLVDGGADEADLEAMESHLEICGVCAAEMAAVKALKAQLDELAARQSGEKSSGQPGLSGTASLSGWRSKKWPRIAIQAAGVAAAIAIVWFVSTIPLRNRVGELKSEIAELRRSSENLQTKADTAAHFRNRIAQLENGQAEPGKGPDQSAGGHELEAGHDRGSGPVSPAGREAVRLRDGGGTFILDSNSNLNTPGALRSEDRDAVKSALIASQVEAPSLIAGLAGRSGMLRGASEGVRFALQSPVGTAVLNDRPTLRWKKLEGASSYTVAVYDSSFNPVASSSPLGATEWTVPQALQRGAIYSWQVTANKDGKLVPSPTSPAPEARFFVIDEASANGIAQAQQQYTNSHLVLGVLFARAGLLDDAERELKALVKANPRSAVARKLLVSVALLHGRS
jgi:hypothetical protein